MADPLSIAASVGGLALLAKDIVKLIVSVTGTVREASSQLQELRQSVALLCGYLESLGLIIDDDDGAPAPMSILACNQTLEKIRRILEKLGGDSAAPSSTSPAFPTKHGAWRDVKKKVRWVIDKDEVAKLLADLERHKSVLSLALSKKSLTSVIEVLKKQDATLQQIKEIRKQQSKIRRQQIEDSERRLSKTRRKMLYTVSSIRPEDSFQKHLSLHQDGTGVWLLESSEFEKFISTPNSKLWLYGIPGAGKSVLSATIIDHISTQRTEHVALAFFFCEYFNTATQTCRNIFGSIVRQLALQTPKALAILEEFYNDQTDLGQLDFSPEDDELLNLIVQMSTTFDSTIVVIDGFDECQENRATVVKSLAQLSCGGIGSIKTLFASRKESDIEERLASFDSLPIAASKADVRLYVAAQLRTRFRKMCEKDPALSEQILNVLVNKSEGMFQWVRCQIDCLENLASNKQRRKALEDLPRDLHGTYERILLRTIKSSEHATIEFVERTLRWIALAMSPLSVAEIAHAISVEVGERSFDDSLDMRIILALCSSLVREVNGNLAFSHFSVKEYLMKISPEEGPVARFRISHSDHSILAQTCLTYLLLDDFNRQGCLFPSDLVPTDPNRGYRAWAIDPYPQYPFYNYAANQWIFHAKACSTDEAIWLLEQDLMNPVKTDQFLFWAHQQLVGMNPSEASRWDLSAIMYEITPLHFACIFSFTELVDLLLCNGAKANAISALLGSPLQCAITKCKYDACWPFSNEDRYRTVSRLLEEPIGRDQSRYDPLSHALEYGDKEMASILLENGFTLTRSALAKLEPGAVPGFLLNADLRNLDVEVELYLKKKFRDLNFLRSSRSTQGGAHRTKPLPFHLEQDYMEAIKASCCYGRLEDVKKFLSRQESLTGNRLSDFLSQCLVDTAVHGHAEVVQFLVEASADPSFQRHSNGRTALHEASNRCHNDVIRTLIEIDYDKTTIPEIQDEEGLTPWMYAIKSGSIETLKLFVASYPTINLQTTAKNGLTAAHLAVQPNTEQMVLYLVERGVDFTCLDDSGTSPIHILLQLLRDSIHKPSQVFESFRRMLRYLHRSDMLSGTLLHEIARMHPQHGKLLWQDIRDNQIFDATRGQALITTDSNGDTPLHVLVHGLTAHLKKVALERYMLTNFMEFVQSLSTGSHDESEQLYMKNGNGCTPAMEFIRSMKEVEISYPERQSLSRHILRVIRDLADVKKCRSPFEEAANDKHTVLHYIAGCRTNFPFRETTELILERPIDVNAKDNSGKSALMRAVCGSQDNIDFIQLLISRMSLPQLEEQDSLGNSTLHYICGSTKAGIEDFINDRLLQPIAECKIRNRHGRIPLTYVPAIITKDAVASGLIKYAEKTIGICDDDGKNCMYWSCEYGSTAMILALLDAGENIDAPIGPGVQIGEMENPPLLHAASLGQLHIVDFLLKKGADPLVKGKGCLQLHHYAFRSGMSSLRTTLERLPQFDYQTRVTQHLLFISEGEKEWVTIDGCAPLHFAAANGDEKGLQWLLDRGKVCDPDLEAQDGSSPLILASLRRHPGMCKRLIEVGSSISKARHDGCTALHVACRYGHREICKILIDADTDCLFQILGDQTPLQIATSNSNWEVVDLLLTYGAKATAAAKMNTLNGSYDNTAELLRPKLSIANEDFHEDRVIEPCIMRLKACETLSESTFMQVWKDVDPNIRVLDNRGTPLHLACQEGWEKAVKLLVERNANIEAMNKDGESPLMTAVRSKQWKCTELLCRKGAQVTTRDKYGWTVLHEAVSNQDSTSLSHFLKHGVEANIKAYEGSTPLHRASDPKCVDLLLEYGADPFILSTDRAGLAWRYSRHRRGGELLRKVFGNQPTEKIQQNIESVYSRYNSTALYCAAFRGNSDVVSTLIEYGAKANGRCGPLGAPLHAALNQGHVKIATTLLENGSRPYRIIRDGEEQAIWFWEYGYDFCLQGQNGVWMSGPL